MPLSIRYLPPAVQRYVAHTFFVTNFTTDPLYPETWTLVVPLLKSSGWNDTRKFPCRKSAITPDEPGNCDYQILGQQTEPDNPEETLGEDDDYDIPACCPDGIVKWFDSRKDNCCVDTLVENPYR